MKLIKSLSVLLLFFLLLSGSGCIKKQLHKNQINSTSTSIFDTKDWTMYSNERLKISLLIPPGATTTLLQEVSRGPSYESLNISETGDLNNGPQVDIDILPKDDKADELVKATNEYFKSLGLTQTTKKIKGYDATLFYGKPTRGVREGVTSVVAVFIEGEMNKYYVEFANNGVDFENGKVGAYLNSFSFK